jgi:hypothetical protein
MVEWLVGSMLAVPLSALHSLLSSLWASKGKSLELKAIEGKESESQDIMRFCLFHENARAELDRAREEGLVSRNPKDHRGEGRDEG